MKKHVRKMRLVTAVLFISNLSSCTSYKAYPLKGLSYELSLKEKEPGQNIEVFATAKALSINDCMKYFDRDLLSFGYQAVQVYIENNSNRAYAFHTELISLPCASLEDVTEAVHTSTPFRVALSSFTSFLLAPIYVGLVFHIVMAVSDERGEDIFYLMTLPFFIPTVYEGICSSRANESLDIDFSSKAAKDTIISPNGIFNKIIFIPKERYINRFSITLIDIESKEPFILDLNTR